MAANDLTAGEIEAPPANEPVYILSARIYDSAANAPDTFNAAVSQLDQDSKSGAAQGVKIDYDPQGKVAAITINNQSLYSSSDQSVPGQLANAQIMSDISNGNLQAAVDDSLVISNTFDVGDAGGFKQAVLSGFSDGLGSLLQSGDASQVAPYLANLLQSGAGDPADLNAVLQKAKDVSGLGDRLTINSDAQSGAVTGLQLDGKDILAPASSGAPQAAAPDATVVTPAADSITGPPAVESQGATPSDSQTAAPSDSQIASPSDSQAAAQTATRPDIQLSPQAPGVETPPVNLFGSDRNDIAPPQPLGNAGADTAPPSGPLPADNPPVVAGANDGPAAAAVSGGDTTGGAAPGSRLAPTSDTPSGPIPAAGDAGQPAGDGTKPAEQDLHQRHQYEKMLSHEVDQRHLSSTVRRGEGYFQVVERMHKNWSEEKINKEAHRIKDLNGDSDELRVGQRLPMISKEEKAAEVKKQMEKFDQAAPEQRSRMLEHLKKESAGREHDHDHESPHQQKRAGDRDNRSYSARSAQQSAPSPGYGSDID
jgi:hypothetical protein